MQSKLFLAKLSQIMDSKNSTYKCIATFLMSHLSEVKSLTIQTVANETKTSYATVCRFVRQLGLSGFKELKNILFLEKQNSVHEQNLLFDYLLTFSENPTFETLRTNICEFATTVIENSTEAIDEHSILTILSHFKKSHRIHFFGLGTSSVSAQYAYIKFFRIKPACSYSTDIVISKMEASMLNKGDILFLFSSSGRTKAVIETAKLAKQHGAIVIAVCDYVNSPLTNIADINICTSIRDANKFLDLDFPLIQGQITIIDIIYRFIYQSNIEFSKSSFDKTKNAVEDDKYLNH